VAAIVVRRTDQGFLLQLEIPYKDAMLDAEAAIQEALNQAGIVATEEVLPRLDTTPTASRSGWERPS
jgi:hypothetical protein